MRPASKGRRPATDEEWARSAGYVYYELSTMVQAFQALQHAEKTSNLPLKNIALEDCLLHYRNLRHFLFPRDPVFADDILAEDFFESAQIPSEFEYQSGKREDDITIKLNKQLAHLSYGRLGYDGRPEKNWVASDLIREVTEGLKSFTAQLPLSRKPLFTQTSSQLGKIRFEPQ